MANHRICRRHRRANCSTCTSSYGSSSRTDWVDVDSYGNTGSDSSGGYGGGDSSSSDSGASGGGCD